MAVLNTFPATPLPEFPEGVDPEYKTQETQFGDGYKLIAEDGINARADRVDLRWENITASEKNTLVNFLTLHAPATPFYYTPIDGTTRVFICRKWNMRRTDAGFFSVSATLEQYHGA